MDWQDWLRRWDVQQTAYIPHREERFTVMLDALEVLLPEDFVALDLCCGPGAISQRLLARFPQAQVIALDMNPALLRLGWETLGDGGGRLQWVQQNLAAFNWTDSLAEPLRRLGRSQFDAVLSTTALHWLPAPHLVRVYMDVGRLVRPGGVLLNGDHLVFGPNLPDFRRLGEVMQQRVYRAGFEVRDAEDYTAWWTAFEVAGRASGDATLAQVFDEYQQTEHNRWHDYSEPIIAIHQAALAEADFTQVATIWQHINDRVLLAVRGEDTPGIET